FRMLPSTISSPHSHLVSDLKDVTPLRTPTLSKVSPIKSHGLCFLWHLPFLKVPGSEGFLEEEEWRVLRSRLGLDCSWLERGSWAVGCGSGGAGRQETGSGRVWGPKAEMVPVLEGPDAR
ncbi:Hypothetical predicted protein, partial [Marmota monax]